MTFIFQAASWRKGEREKRVHTFHLIWKILRSCCINASAYHPIDVSLVTLFYFLAKKKWKLPSTFWEAMCQAPNGRFYHPWKKLEWILGENILDSQISTNTLLFIHRTLLFHKEDNLPNPSSSSSNLKSLTSGYAWCSLSRPSLASCGLVTYKRKHSITP